MTFTINNDFNKQLAEIVGKGRVKDLEHRGFLAAQIVSYRHNKNMTQQDLANAINVTKSTIGRLEAGLTTPNYKTLLALSDALQAPIIIDANRESEKANI
ncbi:helix-turn-helix transcriptional regulator [Salicibibacter cibarius]|uniref:Helix-turn-helix transcriptional regulator n=1 Tax=Salicibibacter cibarius TaxID=2743000 RepID=A0A7T6Z5D7_9BACI|nr:helix-turn-helix transcriptional regulator [Salicibibacter cibarius]QQK77310.1 helix-turn-helix transcriptional regulator [Salicibibacter cibarius]